MKLSVGIPAYDQGRFLGETIESVLALDPAPHEIVVSDNHSTDETAEVLRSFGSAVRVVRPPEHLAMSHHWNFLVGELTGDWFALLSSDDVARPGFTAELRNGAAAAEDAVLVHAGYDVIDEAGSILDVAISIRTKRVRRPPDTLTEQLLGPIVSFAAFAVRRDAWAKVGGFPEESILYSDWGMWLRLVPEGSFVYVPRVISAYRVHRGQAENKRRLLPQLRDLVYVESQVLPETAAAIDYSPSKLARAGRRRLVDQLAHLARGGLLDADEREEAGVILGDLAVRLDCEDVLRRWVAGEAVAPTRRIPTVLAKRLRPPVAALSRLVRR